jgi:hypothetical protein
LGKVQGATEYSVMKVAIDFNGGFFMLLGVNGLLILSLPMRRESMRNSVG